MVDLSHQNYSRKEHVSYESNSNSYTKDGDSTHRYPDWRISMPYTVGEDRPWLTTGNHVGSSAIIVLH